MQTILGAGGAIGTPLAKELTAYTNHIRLVGRNTKKVNDTDELVTADLTNKDEVMKAVAGSEVVYLTVGLLYNIKVWKKEWPVLMQNVIDACIHHKAKLVFLDNVYMYAADEIPHMTENSALNPPSEKGKIRLQLVQMIMNAVKEGKLTALIARSADFYGPDVNSSALKISVFDNFKKGSKAFWQEADDKIHSFTYTPDAAKETALLGNTADAFGEVWHLPTSAEKLTGKEFITMIAAAMKVQPRYYLLKKWMMRLFGLFSSMVKELVEMQYQNNQDYFFDSSKFEKRFGFTATSYQQGISEIVKTMN
jgi:nucleoside-diphosphate-sugar epimerase